MEVTVEEFLKIDNPNVIDIRMPQKYNENHIRRALNINSYDLMNNPEKYLNRSLIYYIYCQKGTSSKTLAQVLRVKGYQVFNIIGGYEEWLLNS